jgi:hypothetical protein
LGDQRFDWLAWWCMFHASDGFGVSKGVSPNGTGPQLNSVVLAHFLRCGTKRFFGTKVRQRPLQWKGILALPDLGRSTKWSHLSPASACTQPLLPNRNLSVSGMPGQEFFLSIRPQARIGLLRLFSSCLLGFLSPIGQHFISQLADLADCASFGFMGCAALGHCAINHVGNLQQAASQ